MSSRRGCTMLDRVYEHVALPAPVKAAMDTRWAQRLRGLKQLGVAQLLYPGAVHTRFEHSVGVAHIARVAVEHLQRRQPELGFTEQDKTAVMLAGLAHDLGHGPFSHVFEDVIARGIGIHFDHEHMSQALARRMIAEAGIAGDVDPDLVLALMGGAAPGEPWVCEGPRRALAEIVSNKRCGIDVDKLDYFMRDSLCCFGKHAADVRVNRLFAATQAMELAPGEWGLAYETKLAVTLREFWTLRAKLHKTVYQHHVVRAAGHMIGDALRLAEPHFTVGGKHLSQCVSTCDDFVLLGDWILDAVAADPAPAMAPARCVIDRVRRRDLFPLVMAACLTPSNPTTSADAHTALVDALVAGGAPRAQAEHGIIVDEVRINHGRRLQDPLGAAFFFNPKAAAPKPRRMLEDVALVANAFTPRSFEERTLLVFVRDPKLVRAARAAAADWETKHAADLCHGLPAHNSAFGEQ